MNNNSLNNDMLNMASKKLGVTPEQLQKSAQDNDLNSLIKNLPKNQADKIKDILSDKEQLEKVFKSDKAQQLLKMFTEGKR